VCVCVCVIYAASTQDIGFFAPFKKD